MKSSNIVRLVGAGGLLVGGLLWLAFGFSEVTPNSQFASWLSYFSTRWLVGVGLLLFGVGMVGLHALHRGRYGHLGQAGFYIAIVGIAALLFTDVFAEQLTALVGLSAVGIGMVLCGIASLRVGIIPRWDSVLLILFAPIAGISMETGLEAIVLMWWGTILVELGTSVVLVGGEVPVKQPPADEH